MPRGQREREIVHERKGGGGGTGDCHNGVNMALFSGWKSYSLRKSLEQNNPGCGVKERRQQEQRMEEERRKDSGKERKTG